MIHLALIYMNRSVASHTGEQESGQFFPNARRRPPCHAPTTLLMTCVLAFILSFSADDDDCASSKPTTGSPYSSQSHLLQRPQPWHLAAGPITAINNALGGLHRISSAIAIVANCSTSHRRLRNLVICRLILVVLLILFGCVVGMMREIIFFCDTKYNWMEHDVLWLPLHCHCHNCHLHLAFHCCRGCITLYR